ncbi:MAG: hypothetical protein LHW56_01500 [Candidatus Cloacimonetes bacterium]|nr:hypothetical protein [Candidatus Cloacimonadota bacterium]MDY0171562.1 hypothetical protein [Candidatus Cloacimonadaceae bacterium]
MAFTPTAMSMGAGMPPQGPLPVQQPSSEEQLFNRRFSDLAFRTFSAKYPELSQSVITFKTVDSDIEEGKAVGAFILQRGNDLAYVPVLLHGGEIVSCEMVYNKQEDTLRPLSKEEVQALLSENLTAPMKMAPKSYTVDRSEPVFDAMFRPPTRSKVLFASAEAFLEVPQAARKALFSYFESRPELLAKIASFYPVEALARKLVQPSPGAKTAAEHSSILPEVIKLSELTQETAAFLDADQKQEILQHGYLITKQAANQDQVSLATKTAKEEMVDGLSLVNLDTKTPMYGVANLLRMEGSTLTLEPALVCGANVVTRKGTVPVLRGLVLSGYEDGITEDVLSYFGAIPCEQAASLYASQGVPKEEGHATSYSSKRRKLITFYPTRRGTYKAAKQSIVSYSDPPKVTSGNGELSIEYAGDILRFVPYLKGTCIEGALCSEVELSSYSFQAERFYPLESRVLAAREDNRAYLTSLDAVHRTIMLLGNRVRILKDGPDYSLLDSRTEKTARFSDQGEVVKYLVAVKGLTKEAVAQALKEKDILLLQKHAEHPYTYYPDQGQPSLEQPQAEGLEQAPDYEVDEEALSPFTDLGDEDLLDTGMLAALSGNQDIKELLLDFAPHFEDTVTHLGKAILVFSGHRKELQEQYGREQYLGVVISLRKAFQLLGRILWDLKKIVQMH